MVHIEYTAVASVTKYDPALLRGVTMSGQTSFQLCNILTTRIFNVICVKPTELRKYQISVILSAIMWGGMRRGVTLHP